MDLKSFYAQAVTDTQDQPDYSSIPSGNKRDDWPANVELPGTWSFDANINQTFRITESKSAQLRVDSTNILNHPSPGTPSLSINSDNPFGYIAAKGTQHREFKATVRMSF